VKNENQVTKDLEELIFLDKKTIHELELFFINKDISSKDRKTLINFINRASKYSSTKNILENEQQTNFFERRDS